MRSEKCELRETRQGNAVVLCPSMSKQGGYKGGDIGGPRSLVDSQPDCLRDRDSWGL